MRKIITFIAVIVILAGCGGSLLPPMKDYELNEITFKAYDGWKQETREEGDMKMVIFYPDLPWGSFALMRYNQMDGATVYGNIKSAFPGMGNEILKEYQVEINGVKFDFFDFKNGDKQIPLKHGIMGVGSFEGFALAIQIYSDFQGYDHEENAELKALAETVKLKQE